MSEQSRPRVAQVELTEQELNALDVAAYSSIVGAEYDDSDDTTFHRALVEGRAKLIEAKEEMER